MKKSRRLLQIFFLRSSIVGDKIELMMLCGILQSNFSSQSESRTQPCHVRIAFLLNESVYYNDITSFIISSRFIRLTNQDEDCTATCTRKLPHVHKSYKINQFTNLILYPRFKIKIGLLTSKSNFKLRIYRPFIFVNLSHHVTTNTHLATQI